MKKIVLSLAIVFAMFVSCKEAATEVENTIDSTTTEVEETATEVMDSTAVVVDSTAVVVDSTVAKVEETAKVSLKRVDE